MLRTEKIGSVIKCIIVIWGVSLGSGFTLQVLAALRAFRYNPSRAAALFNRSFYASYNTAKSL